MGNPGTTAVFTQARPVINLDDTRMADLEEGLLEMLVEENCDGLYHCEITVANWGPAEDGIGFVYFDRNTLEFGKNLVIQSGNDSDAEQIFKGRIMGLEAFYPSDRAPEILVLAEDSLQDMRMTRRTRSFEDVTDSDIMEQIAGEHGLQTDIDVDGATHRVLTQVNQSDLAFLRQRARAIDAELWLENKTLHVLARTRRNTGEIELTYPHGIKDFTVIADLACQCTAMEIGGWDVANKEEILEEATESVIQEELNGMQSGASILDEKLGERKERLVHLNPTNTEEARFLVDANFKKKARRFVTGKGVTEGDGRIHVGCILTMNGLGDMFDGEYYVTEVKHLFDDRNGYETHFKVERPGL